jgi:tetratricopeptide (TPR) repeat protein
VTGDLGSLAIPSTIRGILEARLERLPTTERDVLERGSVEGREFHHGSLSAGGAGETEGALASLVDRGLIEPAVPTLGGGEAFRFRHALIRDAAYARLSKSTRSELHERHARWLGTAAGARLVEHEEVVAYHLEQATKLRADLGPLDPHGRDLAEEAAERLAASGRRAAGRGDVRAAANLLERALALLGDADERGPILVRLAEVCGEIGAYPRAETAFEEALAIAARTSDVRLDTHARLGRGLVRLQHDPEGVGAELRRFASSRIPALEAEGDDLGLARAWKCLAELALMDAQTGEMSAAYERVGLHAERAGDRAALADALGWLSLALMWDRTPPSEAIDRARRLRERLPDDRIVAAMTTTSEGYCLAMTGRIDEGRRRYQEGQRVFRELGLLRRAAGMQDQASRIELMAGDLGEAERQLREGYDTLAAVGERGYLSTQAALLGRLRLERGDLREAEELAGIAEAAGASDDLASAILWQGLRARLLARARDPAAAVELAEANVATAERTDGWDLRADAFTDLADVYRVLGRPRDAARALRAALGVVQEKGVAPLSERIRAELEGLERAAR